MADRTNALAPAPLNALADLYQRYIGQPFAAAAGGGVRGFLGLNPPDYGGDTARQAYRTGQAVGNMPGVGAPAGAFKAAAALPLLANTLRGRILYHGSPRGPIVGQPKTAPHDETGVPGFSLSRSKEYAQSYADDVYERHWDLQNVTPTVTKYALSGRVVNYDQLMDGVRKQYKLTDNDLPSHDQILKYARKKGISGIDYSKTLGVDEISVLFPEFLQQID